MRLLVDYALALAGDDVDALTRIGTDLQQCGYLLHGYRALVAAARRLRSRGDYSGAADRGFAAWEAMRERGTDLSELFAPLAADVDLTRREKEICEAVARGLVNQSIADQFVDRYMNRPSPTPALSG